MIIFILSYPIILLSRSIPCACPILSYPILSYPIVWYSLLSYPLSHLLYYYIPILSYYNIILLHSYPSLSYPILSYLWYYSTTAKISTKNSLSNTCKIIMSPKGEREASTLNIQKLSNLLFIDKRYHHVWYGK